MHAQTAHFAGAQRVASNSANNGLALMEALSNGEFGAVKVGSTSPTPISLIFTFNTVETLGSTAVVTQGAPGLDFADAGTGTCKAGSEYNPGNTCTVNVSFSPKFAGTRYGIPFPVYCRASFGTAGANLPAMVRAVIACGWFGIQTWIGGTAVLAIAVVFKPEWGSAAAYPVTAVGITVPQLVAFLAFWAVNMAVIFAGEAENLLTLADARWDEAQSRFGATHAFFRLNVAASVRRHERADLIGAYAPPMNAADEAAGG